MARAPTIITAGTTVSGRIEGAEDVEVFGAVKGSVQLDGSLFIDEKARVDADLSVSSLTIQGILVGNAAASEVIELTASARVIGDLTAPRVIVEDGAHYRGTIDMGQIEGDDEKPAAANRPAARAPARPAPARPAPAPARPAPRPAPAPSRPAPPARPAEPPRKAAPVVEAPPEPELEDEDDEPELPDGAAEKKVAVKKRAK